MTFKLLESITIMLWIMSLFTFILGLVGWYIEEKATQPKWHWPTFTIIGLYNMIISIMLTILYVHWSQLP